jgi:very-short-patch-repair endonuclease
MNKVCLECGKTFEALPSIAERRIFCSKPCMWKAFKDNRYFEGYRQKRREIYDRKLRSILGQPELIKRRNASIKRAHNIPSVKAKDVATLKRVDVQEKHRLVSSKLCIERNRLPSNPFRQYKFQVKGAIAALEKMKRLGTSIENTLYGEFASRGLTVQRHYQLWDNNKLVRVADLAIPERKIIIECDGDFWHANPAKFPHENLKPIQLSNVRKDIEKDFLTKSFGWKVYRFFETEINRNASDCVEKVVCGGDLGFS